MKRYEHTIIDADDLDTKQYGKWGWKVVGVLPGNGVPRVILERERAASISDDRERRGGPR